MRRIRLGGVGTANVRPEVVWNILTDYRNGQPLIFPEVYRRVVIEEGGKGEGTVLLYFPPVPAKMAPERVQVTVLEPGRVFAETNSTTGSRTYTLMPVEGGEQTRVEVVSYLAVGLIAYAGWLVVAPFMLYIQRKVFRRLLNRLEYVAQTWDMSTGAAQV